MKVELFIARRLKLGADSKSTSPSLSVATIGIVLAILIMILSVVIVMGFKREITTKLFSLNPHLKVSNAVLGIDDNFASVNLQEVMAGIKRDTALMQNLAGVSLMAEKPTILKTDEDFKGLVYRGVDDAYDWTFLKNCLVEGRVPQINDTADVREIIVSKTIASQLHLGVGDKIYTYFIENKVKARRAVITGIFNTDFDTFDKAYIVGNIAQLQSVNGWDSATGNFVGVNLKSLEHTATEAQRLYAALAQATVENDYNTLHLVNTIEQTDRSYFTWLGMLNMNVIIILVLMVIVSSFTLIAALLMVVLERIKMVGLLKALGAPNRMIRKIFIYLTSKLIIKAIVIGNVLGIGLAWLQQQLHIIQLDAASYYMSYVPIEISPSMLLLLNAGIIVVSWITLIAPSHIVSTIKPTSTMKFE